MLDPLDIHSMSAQLECPDLTVVWEDVTYVYHRISDTEFQFYREGDVPTNYVVPEEIQ